MRLVVIDTNCLVQMVSRRSRYYPLWEALLAGSYAICVTTDIIDEYEEILGRLMSPSVARMAVELILKHPLTVRVEPHFRFRMIVADPDDNKFVDCAVIAGADYIVSEDSHFRVLKVISFPKVNVISLDGFMADLGGQDAKE